MLPRFLNVSRLDGRLVRSNSAAREERQQMTKVAREERHQMTYRDNNQLISLPSAELIGGTKDFIERVR